MKIIRYSLWATTEISEGSAEICAVETFALGRNGTFPAGRETDIGCVHAEENAILNCARQGVSGKGAILYVNGEPCAKCATRIAQVGIIKVVCYGGSYPQNGLEVLKTHNIETEVIIK